MAEQVLWLPGTVQLTGRRKRDENKTPPAVLEHMRQVGIIGGYFDEMDGMIRALYQKRCHHDPIVRLASRARECAIARFSILSPRLHGALSDRFDIEADEIIYGMGKKGGRMSSLSFISGDGISYEVTTHSSTPNMIAPLSCCVFHPLYGRSEGVFSLNSGLKGREYFHQFGANRNLSELAVSSALNTLTDVLADRSLYSPLEMDEKFNLIQ